MPLQIQHLIWIGLAGSLGALAVSLFLLYRILRGGKEEADPFLSWSNAVRKGERVFLRNRYLPLLFAFCLFLALFFALSSLELPGGSLLAGAFLSGGLCAVLVELLAGKAADTAGVSVARGVRESLNRALGAAFSSGAVAGFAAVGLGLLHVTGWMLFLTYGAGYGPADTAQVMLFAGIGGCLMAFLLRLSGCLFSQGAKLGSRPASGGAEPQEAPLPACCLGGGMGTVAGAGVDLFACCLAALPAALALGAACAEEGLLWSALVYPLAVTAIGVFCSVIAALLVRVQEKAGQKELLFIFRRSCYTAAILTGAVCIPVTYLLFGAWEPWFPVLTGLVAGCGFSYWTEGSTSAAFGPVRRLARAAETGSEAALLEGLGIGMRSSMGMLLLASLSILIAFLSAGGSLTDGSPELFAKGCYGVALAAVGLVSTLGITLGSAGAGPAAVSGGKLAAAQWPEDGAVEERAKALVFLGSSADAGGKGFSAGAALLSAGALLLAGSALFRSQTAAKGMELFHPGMLAGILLGAMTAFGLAYLVLRGVQRSGQAGAEELRRQRREKGQPAQEKRELSPAEAYTKRCVRIALRQTLLPGLLALAAPLVTGLLLGIPVMLALALGVAVTGFFLSVCLSSTGSAWNNAAEYIAGGKLGGAGSPCHRAALLCAGLGDPFREAVGPALNSLMKLCAVTALFAVPLLLRLDLYALLSALLGA